MAEESHTDDRIWRAIDQHRARALQQLDAIAANALGDLFPSRRRASSPDCDHVLARTLARDLSSAAVLGSGLHRDLQETMNFDLAEVLRILGYAVKVYGSGAAHVVTAPR